MCDFLHKPAFGNNAEDCIRNGLYFMVGKKIDVIALSADNFPRHEWNKIIDSLEAKDATENDRAKQRLASQCKILEDLPAFAIVHVGGKAYVRPDRKHVQIALSHQCIYEKGKMPSAIKLIAEAHLID